MRRILKCTVSLILLCQLGDSVRSHAAEPADLVLIGGKIITLDPQQRVVTALAVQAEKIIAVGSDAQIEALVAAKTEVIRLHGLCVLPGFIESHCHAVGVARGELDQEYTELSSIGELQEWVRRAAREIPEIGRAHV